MAIVSYLLYVLKISLDNTLFGVVTRSYYKKYFKEYCSAVTTAFVQGFYVEPEET
jgi:hypothetical protein